MNVDVISHIVCLVPSIHVEAFQLRCQGEVYLMIYVRHCQFMLDADLEDSWSGIILPLPLIYVRIMHGGSAPDLGQRIFPSTWCVPS